MPKPLGAQIAKAVAQVLNTPLVRLQCYEGIDAAEALYEWNYPRQLLAIRLAESTGRALEEQELFGPDYLIPRAFDPRLITAIPSAVAAAIPDPPPVASS